MVAKAKPAKAGKKAPVKVAKKAAVKKAAVKKTVAKKTVVKKAPAKAASKPLKKAAAKLAPPVKPGKAAARTAPRAAAAKTASGTAKAAGKPVLAPVPPAVMIAPRAAPAAKAAPVVSPKDMAAAHEYLLSRSAGRSEAPVVVNGRRLPTEEQLLQMPDSAYMNAEQLAFFKHWLRQLEQELVANAGETTEHLRETVIVPDPADRATIEEEHALELRTRDRERKLLKKVREALQRIEAGDYGFCEETGEPIGIPRLLARPTATLSLEAQQRREMKQKLFGD